MHAEAKKNRNHETGEFSRKTDDCPRCKALKRLRHEDFVQTILKLATDSLTHAQHNL